MTKKYVCGFGALVIFLAFSVSALAQPLDPEKLPATINASARVHFASIDNSFTAPNTNWLPCLKILTGGDQVINASSRA